MRLGIVVGAFVTTSLVAGVASAAPHYLLARGVNQFNGTASVQSPDLKGEVTGAFALGTPTDDVFVNGTATTSSDRGTLKFNVGGGAKPAAGTTANTPNNWSPASRIQETMVPGAKVPTKVAVSFSATGSGSIKTTQGGTVKLSGTLKIGSACSVTFNQYVTSGAAKAPDVTNNCNDPKFEVVATPNSISIVAPFNGTSIDVDAQILGEVTYGGVGFDGTAEASMEGQLRVSGVDGDLKGTSPTFGSQVAPPDGGAPGGDGGGSSSSSGGGSSSGGSSSGGSADGGSSSGASTGGGDDGGGCNTGGAPLSFGAPLVAAAIAAALARRSRRRGSA